MLVDLIEPILDDVVFSSYDGDINKKSGVYHGAGSTTLDNENTYIGKFKNGMFHGKGKFNWSDGVTFEGDFNAGEIKGKGVYVWTDGSTYQGDVFNGLRHGCGKFTGANGQVYEGEWRLGKRHGTGKIWYSDDKTSHYTGEWVENMREGYGLMRYASGNSYEGMWKTDRKCGLGAMVWRDVDEVYTGQWQDGQPHGEGEHIWGDSSAKTVKKNMCNLYRGAFQRGKREGFGSFFFMNGSQYSGQWAADQKCGEGVFVHPDGKIFAGLYEENRVIHALSGARDERRATDDVSPQYELNIADVLDRYPVTTDLMDAGDSYEHRTRELERLLLKYNHCVKQAYKRHSELANKSRSKELTGTAGSSSADPLTATLSNEEKVLRTISAARVFQKRLFCMSLSHMVRFLRECGLAGTGVSQLTASDVARCLRGMRVHHETVAAEMMQRHRRQLVEEGVALDNSALEAEVRICPVLAAFLCTEEEAPSDLALSPTQPILEREFTELLVRCVSETASRRGGAVAHMTLFRSVYQVLAEKLLPLMSDLEGRIPQHYQSFYSDNVQELLRAPQFVQMWALVTGAAAVKNKPPQVQDVVSYLLSTRLLRDTCTSEEVVRVVTGEGQEQPFDCSYLSRRIDLSDFLDMFCTLAASSLWIYGLQDVFKDSMPPLNGNNEGGSEQSGGSESVHSPSEEAKDATSQQYQQTSQNLSERLQYFVDSYVVNS